MRATFVATSIASGVALGAALVSCSYDFARFEHAALAGDASIDASIDAFDASVDAADVFDGEARSDAAPQDTSLIGDVAGWPTAAGTCTAYTDDARARTYVVCSPKDGTTPFALARTYCTDHGMDLATIDDEKTNTFVFQSLIAAGGAGYKAWIGLKFRSPDAGEEVGQPYWVSGAALTYQNFATLSDNGLTWEENCGNIFGGDGEWRDYFCSYASFWFVCGPP